MSRPKKQVIDAPIDETTNLNTTPTSAVDAKMTELVRDKETKALLEFVIKRLDSFEEAMVSMSSRIDGQNARQDSVEAVMRGEDAGFETKLKGGSGHGEPPVLNKSQAEVYGTLAGTELQEVVHRVLGSDCHAFIKADSVLPRSFFSVFIPERLCGKPMELRSAQLNNASALQDAKKRCEMIKSNLFRQYAADNKGVPDFRTK